MRRMRSGALAVPLSLSLLAAGIVAMPTIASFDATGETFALTNANLTFLSGGKTSAAANTVAVYSKAANIQGLDIDVVVTVNSSAGTIKEMDCGLQSTIPQGGATANGGSASNYCAGTTGVTDSYWDLLTMGSGTYAFTFAFFESGSYSGAGTGIPVVLNNLVVSTLDLDSLQAAQFFGFQTYRTLKDSGGTNSIVTASNAGNGKAKFTSSNTGLTGFNECEGIAEVSFNSVSSFGFDAISPSTGVAGFLLVLGNTGLNCVTSSSGNNPANRPPTAQDSVVPVRVATDFTYLIEQVNFGYQDPDGNPLVSVTLQSTPSGFKVQRLLSSGAWSDLTAGDVITAAEIDARKIRISNVTGSSSLSFKVSDGLAFSTSANTISLEAVDENQTITFANPGAKATGTTFASNATASSGLPVTLTSNTTGVCTVNNSTLEITTGQSEGTCSVTATQDGGLNASDGKTYSTAQSVTQVFSVSAKTSQTITFPSIGTQSYRGTNIVIASNATASGGGLVTLSTSTADVCTVSGLDITVIAVGTCTVKARQAGDATYAPAETTRTFSVVYPSPLAHFEAARYSTGTTWANEIAGGTNGTTNKTLTKGTSPTHVKFQGTNSSVPSDRIVGTVGSIGTVNSSTRMTLEIFVKLQDVAGFVFSWNDGTTRDDYGLFLDNSADRLGFNTFNSDNYYIDVSPYYGKWTHFVFVFGDPTVPSTQKIYVNGQSQALTQVPWTDTAAALDNFQPDPAVKIPASGNFVIMDTTRTDGDNNTITNFGAQGELAFAKVFLGEISSGQVSAAYSEVDINYPRISFNANTGSGSMAEQVVNRGVVTDLVANTLTPPANTTFSSWNTISGGSGTSYADSDQITLTNDVTLFAQWSAVSLGVPTVTLSYSDVTVPTLSSSPTLNKGGSSGAASYSILAYSASDAASGCNVNQSTGVVTATSAGKCKVGVSVAAAGGYESATTDAFATFLKSSQSISWTNTTVDVRSPAGVVTQRNLTSNPNYATAVDVQYTLQLKLGETVKIPFNSPNSQRVGYTSHANCPSVVGWNGEQSMFVFDGSGNSNYYIKANRVGGCSISSGNHVPQRLTLPSNLYNNDFSSGILITVVKGDQSPIEVTGPTTANFGETVKLDATGGSGTGARTYSVTGTGCTITTIPLVFGNRTYTALSTAELTKSGAGACSVTVTKAGDNNYEAITSAGYTVTFGQGSQEIGFTSVVPALPVASDTYTPAATSSSGLTVAFTASGACTYDFLTGQVTFTGSGNCTVTASQAGNSDYLAATNVTQVIAVGERNQTISFAAISDKEYGDPAFQVSATSSANLTVAFSSADTNVCTINSSGVIVLKTAGTCTIHADQAGQAGTVAAASRVSRSFTVFAAGSSAPFITSVSRGVGSLSANIIAPSYTGGASILRYEVQAFDSAGDLVSFNNNCAPADPQVCTVEGLAEGVNYTLKARAHHNGGVGAFSPSSIAASPIGNPDAVRALSATAGNTTLRIQWLKPLDLGGASFVRYDVFYREVGAANYQAQALQINCGGDTTGCDGLYDITGLTNGTSYEVKMITVTNFADSELVSNTALVSQVPYTTPNPVRDLSATEVGNDLLITWRYPDFDGGRQITSYTVDVNSGGLSCTPGVERFCTVPTTTIARFDIDTFANNIAGASSAANFVFTRQVPQQGGGGSGGGGGGSSGGGTPPVQQVPGLGAPALTPASPSANAGIPTALELSGSNLNLINGVFIGLQPLQFEILSNEKIRVIIPARSAGELTLEFRYTGGMIEKKVVVRQASRAAVNAGTFRGVVALYAAGYAGQRFSAKVGRDWVVVDRLSSNYVRLIERVGAGRQLKINIFINRKLVRTIDLTTR